MAKFKGVTKFQWNKPALKKLVGEAAAKALQRAGMDCRKSVQRMMSNRAPLKTPQFWRLKNRSDGYPMVAIVRQIPKKDRVTSWKTPVHPKGFLRQDIQTDWDATTQSVVIGPSKVPWLNQLHEDGGHVQLWFVSTKKPVGTYKGKKLPARLTENGKYGRGAYTGWLSNRPMGDSVAIGSRTVPGRGYMIIGLQAMIHRIPEQFQNTIRSSGGSIG